MTEPPSYIPPTAIDRAFVWLDALPLPVLMLVSLTVAMVVIIGGTALLMTVIAATAPTQHHPCMEVYQQATGLVKVYCER